MLGLGALLCLLLATHETRSVPRRLAVVLMVGFLIQNLLTLSRGGFLTALICMAVLGFHTFANARLRQGLLSSLFLLIFAGYIIVPQLSNEN